MKDNKTRSKRVGNNEEKGAARPRRPLRKPPQKPLPHSPSKPTGNKPAQSSESTKPNNK